MSKIDDLIATTNTADEMVAQMFGHYDGRVTDYEKRVAIAYLLDTLYEYKSELERIATSNGCAAVRARAVLERTESLAFAQNTERRFRR